jgi:hypothetical protein
MSRSVWEGFWVAGLVGAAIGGMVGYTIGLASPNPSATAFSFGFVDFLVFGSIGALVAYVSERLRRRRGNRS